jgi:hypothetical protein
MQVVSEVWSEKQTPTNKSTQKVYAWTHKKLVGKSKLHLIVCREKMSVGKEISVGKENVGRERFTCGVGLLVGKYMLAGKDLCRLDLQ